MTKRKAKPKHGPVRRIADPKELARLEEKYRGRVLANEPVECTGNKMTLRIGDSKREISDHHISALLDIDAARPAGKKLNRKTRKALADFRRKLSQQGADSFTALQKEYLGWLIKEVENPSEKTGIAKEDREKRNRRIRAFFAFEKLRKSGTVDVLDSSTRRMIDEVITFEALAAATAKAAKILEPYRMTNYAWGFVYITAKEIIHACIDEVRAEVPAQSVRRHLFNRLFNPKSAIPLEMFNDIGNVVDRLRRELEGVPLDSTETVKEKMNYIITSAASGQSSSIHDIPAGSPGSGKGGKPQ